jgi:hypothetical protein
MTFEKWIVGILAVAFTGSVLWVFTRSRSSGPEPAAPTPASESLPVQAPPLPEATGAGGPLPSPTSIRTGAPTERRWMSGGTSGRRVSRVSRTSGAHAHRPSRRHRHAKHVTRAPRPAAPKSKAKA